jgi:hypothetical protein
LVVEPEKWVAQRLVEQVVVPVVELVVELVEELVEKLVVGLDVAPVDLASSTLPVLYLQ